LRVSVVGLGYVGLVTSACLAEWGHQVIGVDVDERRVNDLDSGRLPFHEPGLDGLVSRNRQAGRLAFRSSVESLSDADIVFVAVGTHDGNGGWQTETLRACLSAVVPVLKSGATLVVRSTLAPEFVATMATAIDDLRGRSRRGPLQVLFNPEFTREGSAIRDFTRPDRVVIGLVADPSGRGEALLRDLYQPTRAPIVVMPAVDAALAKLASNLFLATKISFANELASLCDLYGATVDRVIEVMAFDPRIGGQFLHAGVGFGGSCLPHQVTMVVRGSTALGLRPSLLSAVEDVNQRQRTAFVQVLSDLVGGQLEGKRIALLGLTFKPDTDDLRDAPSLLIATLLLERGASVVAYDPMPGARSRAAMIVPALETTDMPARALDGADAVGLVTDWPEFADLDWAALGRSMRRAAIADGRNALSPAAMVAAGFTYRAFGRGLWMPQQEQPRRPLGKQPQVVS
jgi:UDPglucose 6-dehydrogenase